MDEELPNLKCVVLDLHVQPEALVVVMNSVFEVVLVLPFFGYHCNTNIS